jgi:hypothetical protein
LSGKWQIVEMEVWDKKVLDMLEPAYIASTVRDQANSSSVVSSRTSTATMPARACPAG